MMLLVTGGSGSGKSAYAEERFSIFSGEKYYIATMQVYDAEGQKKVLRHRKLREGKGFLTVEKSQNIGELFPEADGKPDRKHEPGIFVMPAEKSAILECVSNLTANEMFLGTGIVPWEQTAEKVIRDMTALTSRLENLVVVTNNVFEDGIRYDDTTMDYLRAMGKINETVAKLADEVVEVVCGIPVRVK